MKVGSENECVEMSKDEQEMSGRRMKKKRRTEITTSGERSEQKSTRQRER